MLERVVAQNRHTGSRAPRGGPDAPAPAGRRPGGGRPAGRPAPPPRARPAAGAPGRGGARAAPPPPPAALRRAARLMGRRSRRVERVGVTRPPGRTQFLSGHFCINRSSAGHDESRTRLTSRSRARIGRHLPGPPAVVPPRSPNTRTRSPHPADRARRSPVPHRPWRSD